MVQTCMDDKNSEVRQNVFYALNNLIDKFPERIMSIFQVGLEQRWE